MRKFLIPAVALLLLTILASGQFGGEVSAESQTSLSSQVSTQGNASIYLPIIPNVPCPQPSPTNENLEYHVTLNNANKAWNCFSSGGGIVLAVVDSGVDLNHPDLRDNLLPGFYQEGSSPDDGNGHGTHVAGIAGAVANNGGVVGVAPQVKIIPVRVLGSNGTGSASGVAAGIVDAVDGGAHIINMSLGSTQTSSAIFDAVNYAADNDVLLIAASGNCGDSFYFLNGCSSRHQTSYPAGHSVVVSVGATTDSLSRSSFSTANSTVELAAPGSSILSTYKDNQYAKLSGTSMASPNIAGTAALAWAANPSLSASDMRLLLRDAAIDLGPTGRDNQFGYGFVDAYEAVRAATFGTTSIGSLVVEAESFDAIDPSSVAEGDYVAGEVLIQTNGSLSADQLMAAVHATDVEARSAVGVNWSHAKSNLMTLSVPVGSEVAFIELIAGIEGVVSAELNIIYRAY